jgi:hypothetical protein
VHRRLRGAYEFSYESIRPLANNVRHEVITIHRTQNMLENVILLHVDILRTGERGYELPFEAVLQGYLQNLYEYFLLVFLSFGVYFPKVCPSDNPRRKHHKD